MWFEKTWCQYLVINSLVLYCLPKTWIHFSCKCYTHVPAICLMESVSKTTQMSYSGSIASYQQTYPVIGFNHTNLPQWAQFYGSYCTLYGQHSNTAPMNISHGQRWTKSTLGFHSPHFFCKRLGCWPWVDLCLVDLFTYFTTFSKHEVHFVNFGCF